MKVFITKYVLTKGIFTEEVKECSKEGNVMTTLNNYVSFYHGEGKDWHKTAESAIKRAEEMRENKIKSLEKQIKKLKALKFT